MTSSFSVNLNNVLYLFGGSIFSGAGFLAISSTCKAFYTLVKEKAEDQWREICRREWGLEGEYPSGTYQKRYRGIWQFKHNIVGAGVQESERAELLLEQANDRTKYTKNWDDFLKNRELSGRKFQKLMKLAFEDEEIVVTPEEAKSVIQPVEGFGLGLILAQRPTVLVGGSSWDGSIVRLIYQAYGRETTNVEESLARVRSILTHGILDVNCSLKEQLKDLICLLSPGSYQVRVKVLGDMKEHHYTKDGCNYVSCSDYSVRHFQQSFFTYDSNCAKHIYFTQSSACINPERVRYYVDQIAAGVRPFMFAVQLGPDLYLVDGHHKLAAYLEADVEPYYICISDSDREIAERREEMKRLLDLESMRSPYASFCLSSRGFMNTTTTETEMRFFRAARPSPPIDKLRATNSGSFDVEENLDETEEGRFFDREEIEYRYGEGDDIVTIVKIDKKEMRQEMQKKYEELHANWISYRTRWLLENADQYEDEDEDWGEEGEKNDEW